MERAALMILFSSLFTVPAAKAQQAMKENYRETRATVVVTHGKHSHTYLAYEVNGKNIKCGITSGSGVVEGAKFIIAYDTTHPYQVNTFDFTRPIFDAEDKTMESTAKVVQTNFGSDIRYGSQRVRWIKYAYYAPPRPGSTRSKRFTTYLSLPADASVDTNGITGQYFKVVYSPGNPNRSIIHYTERIADATNALGYSPKLADHKEKTYYMETVFPIGLFMFNTQSNYSAFTFHFSDAATGTNFTNTKRPFQAGLLYGANVQLPYISLYRRNGIFSLTPVNFAFGNGDNVTYIHFGPSVGYQKQLTRRLQGNNYVLYPAVKAAVAVNVSYSNLSYDLGSLESANGKDLHISGENVSTSSTATYSRRALRVAPEAGVYIRCSRKTEFRFSTICNLEALHYENIRFYHNKNYYANTQHLSDYLSDGQGNPIAKTLFMPVPLITFKVECALGGGN